MSREGRLRHRLRPLGSRQHPRRGRRARHPAPMLAQVCCGIGDPPIRLTDQRDCQLALIGGSDLVVANAECVRLCEAENT